MHIRSPIEWTLAQIETPSKTIGDAKPETYWADETKPWSPVVQTITTADLKAAVQKGLDDFGASRTDVMFMCLIYPALGLFIAAAEAHKGLLPLLFPTASGFALVGPFCAIGLYEMSRRRELKGKASWADMFGVLHSPSIWPIIGLGLMLIGFFLAWIGVAQVVYDVTLGPQPPVSTGVFLNEVFTTGAGWAMIIIGCALGAVFAAGALAVSVVSFPLMLERPVKLGTAISTSLEAVRQNPVPLLLWGLFVGAALVVGALPCFVGLIIVLPVLGHSTWHLYRRLVR